ncbi:MAG TPA: bifunctional diguanylate cyclase/phosphodiesterase, partial [Terriglobales bacterium]
LARTGGDEFTAVICDINDGRDAAIVAESLVNALNEPFEVDGNTLFGGASIGIAVYPQDGRDIDTLQRNADRAMYRAKAQGRNGIQFYAAEEAREDIDRSDIEFHLHRAIEQGNFALHYQPQFTCDRRLCGFEALLRFNHPKLGLVPPSRFIPMAEESGLILPIGEWVLREACRQIAEWQQKGMRPVRVAVNVSPLQFTHANFAETVSRAIQSADINPEFLELEITEGVLMSSVRESSRQMAAMGELGVRLAVDDFGTGYSSLSYLHQLPINLLKIDRSFISHMLEPDGTRCIVEAIISLAHRLGLETLAEGVENHEQLAQLHAAGCNLIQGFLFSKPLSADDAAALLWQDTMSTAGAAASSKSRKTRNQPQIRLKPGR